MARFVDLNRQVDIGSNCMLLELGPFRIILDCGLHPKKYGLEALPDFSKIEDLSVDFVILSHCHLDHLGGLPVLLRNHPTARVLASSASKIVASRILRNCINVMSAQREEKKIMEYPLYTYSELDRVDAAITAIPYHISKTFYENDDSITFTFYPAGHVAGSAGCMIEYHHQKIFYTGDVCFHPQNTIGGAEFPEEKIDVLITETTRGALELLEETDRDKEINRFITDITNTLSNDGSVLVPSFAFGRMQEIFLILHKAKKEGKIPQEIPIFCTGLGMDLADYFDNMSKKTNDVRFHRSIIKEANIQVIREWEEPGNNVKVKGIYVVSSGMLVEKTPAWHIAANMLSYARNMIAFVGYCDPDTPGGRLLTRTSVDELRFADMNYIARVLASVSKYDFSGHVTRERMMEFINSVDPRVVILQHGDPEARTWFEEEIYIQLPNTKVIVPQSGESYEI